ncbi:type VII secretion protein EccB [Streptomyces sp. TRM70308]|uniref:type VII secretion protein EccB n=1 Tax=Streptomyces sp. TRM70308 TaxID=3131932 RepID=UPI003D0476B3
MATTREQAESHAYENRRQTTSLLRGADEALHDPRRRLHRSLAGGVAVGILIMAGFGIAGWLGGGDGPDLPGNGAVVVSGSGDRYVVSDGTVHPALNLSSALLVGGGKLTEVRPDALADAPRGLPLGIPAAPDALPGAGDLSDDPWTVCAVPATDGRADARTHLYVGVPGAAPPPARRGPRASATVLTRSPGNTLWLLAEGRRYRLAEGIGDALGLQRAERVPLSDTLLATVPEAPAISTPDNPRGAAPNAPLPVPAAVGDLAHSDLGGVNPQYYLVRPDGLVSVSELVYTLLRTTEVTEHELTPAQAASAPRSGDRPPGDPAWPERLPEATAPDRNQPLCVTTPPGSAPGDAPWEATVHLPERLPEPPGLAPVAPADGSALGELDAVYVPPGRGAVVRATASAGTGGTYTLVTDGGTAYAFASPEAVERLRYTPGEAPAVPKSYVALLPHGPVLDPRAAAVEHRGSADTGEPGGDPPGGGADGETGDGGARDADGTGEADGPDGAGGGSGGGEGEGEAA